MYHQKKIYVEGGSWQYLLTKLVQGLLAALLAALLAPAFLPADATAMSQNAETYLGNALAGGSLLLASSVAMAGTYLAALVLAKVANRPRTTADPRRGTT